MIFGKISCHKIASMVKPEISVEDTVRIVSDALTPIVNLSKQVSDLNRKIGFIKQVALNMEQYYDMRPYAQLILDEIERGNDA